MRDVADAYRRAQAFKEERLPDAELIWALRERLEAGTRSLGLPPEEAYAALHDALRGIAWTTAMMAEYDLPLDQTMDVASEVARTVSKKAPQGLDTKTAIEVGVGGGYFTGLLMGLLLGSVP